MPGGCRRGVRGERRGDGSGSARQGRARPPAGGDRGGDAAPGEAVLDGAGPSPSAVTGLVHAKLARPASWASCAASHGRHGVRRGHERLEVMPAGPGQGHAERRAVPVRHETPPLGFARESLRARFAAVRGIGLGHLGHIGDRRMALPIGTVDARCGRMVQGRPRPDPPRGGTSVGLERNRALRSDARRRKHPLRRHQQRGMRCSVT